MECRGTERLFFHAEWSSPGSMPVKSSVGVTVSAQKAIVLHLKYGKIALTGHSLHFVFF